MEPRSASEAAALTVCTNVPGCFKVYRRDFRGDRYIGVLAAKLVRERSHNVQSMIRILDDLQLRPLSLSSHWATMHPCRAGVSVRLSGEIYECLQMIL